MAVEYIVDRRDRLEAGEFSEAYVRRRRPVLVKRALEGCAALSRWSLDYLRLRSGDRQVLLKEWGPSGIEVVSRSLGAYIASLKSYEARHETDEAAEEHRPAYLHDVPLTSILPEPDFDLEDFPLAYFPLWYQSVWPQFAQLFLGPSHSFTPMHFDCLLTHNLFFQIKGRKRFVLVPPEQIKYCYPHHWRWCKVDAEKPDYDLYPLFRLVSPAEVIVEPGDVLYLPPGTLHYVRSLDCALSFNVDWHTKDSALSGALACLRGMPWKNVYYNIVIAAGLWGGVPAKRLLPYYRSYLNYVS